MRRSRPTIAALPALLALALLAASCSDGRQSPPSQAVGPRQKPAVFTVIGGRESSGSGLRDSLHDAWPQVVFSTAFPAGTVYVNLARDGATVADSIKSQLPLALSQKPTVAVVWLGEGDDAAGTDPTQFARDLGALLEGLRRGNATRVLVAGPPTGAVGVPYATAITGAARTAGAELVRLSAEAWNPQARREGRVAVQAAAAAELGRAVKG